MQLPPLWGSLSVFPYRPFSLPPVKLGWGIDKFVTGRWSCESDGSLFTPLSQGSLVGHTYYGMVSAPFTQSSGVEHLPSTCEALDSVLGTDKKTENHPTKLPPRI